MKIQIPIKLDGVKGIVLAGGTGSRLWPLTLATSKQLLPVHDKPMIYYPIATLMLAGIREILIISTPTDIPNFKKLLGDGSELGIEFSYEIQSSPKGIAEAFLIGEKFIRNDSVALALGDNILVGSKVGSDLERINSLSGAMIFAVHVADPERYGVVEFDSHGDIKSITEKPKKPPSNFAIPGLYFYDNAVISIAKKILPSSRGELEITSINQSYLEAKLLKVTVLPRSTVWMDAGTIESLHDANTYIRGLESRQNLKIACLEEIALSKGWVDTEQIQKRVNFYGENEYGQYLRNLI